MMIVLTLFFCPLQSTIATLEAVFSENSFLYDSVFLM